MFIKDKVTNYSREGFRISVSVGLSYDTDRVKAENALIKAAKLVHLEDVYVAITGLDNHAITFELNGTSHDPNSYPFVKSQLMKMVFDP